MSKKPYLSVVIPAYNEEERLAPTLAEIALYFSRKDFITEIIVIDDGSKDNTTRMVTQTFSNREVKKYTNILPYLKKHRENAGKGAALKTGIMAASGTYILLTDANGSTPISEFEKLHAHTNLYDLIVGSRSIQTAEYKPQYFLKKIINMFTFSVGKSLFKIPIFDILSDFRLIETKLAKEIVYEQFISKFGFDVETLVRARYKGVFIKETPVMWHGKKDGKIRSISESLDTIIDLIKLRQQNFK
jgi:dolichyl-phosphate beta-glucosyltransferase